jgi:hypothetical protein
VGAGDFPLLGSFRGAKPLKKNTSPSLNLREGDTRGRVTLIMNGFKMTLKVFMIIMVAAGIVTGVIGAVIANQTLIVTSVILMSIPLILKLINDLILEEWITAIIPGLGIAAIIFLYIWTPSLGSSATNALDRPVLWVVGGVGISQLLWIFLGLREL